MKRKKIIAIIPARMGSTRFPGKPLKKILDLPLIEHVRRRVLLCDAVDEVYVATCDHEIRAAVEGHGGSVIMTSSSHERCTDRIEEAAGRLKADIIVNVQGDEPLILPDAIKELVRPLQEKDSVSAVCLIYPILHEEDLTDLNTVKAVLDKNNFILYFSRSPIPNFERGRKTRLFEQSGIMAYEKDFLHKYTRLPQTPLECAESVDMLRILEHGFKVYGVVTNNVTIEVDIAEHIPKVENAILNDEKQRSFYERILKT